LLIFFYIAGGMGAGDVKLMGAVGSFLGPLGSFRAFLCTALVGGLYALVVIIRTEGLKSTIRRFGAIAVNLYSKITYKPMYVSHAGFKGMPVLYYGVAIAIGTFLSMLDCTKEILF
jgi:prepilin peptidase CpaA